MHSFNHIILGTGQATGTLLGKLIPTGDSIAVIEANEVGGSCVNYGCTPTKALVASAAAIHNARRGAEYGFSTGRVNVDFPRVKERMDAIRHASRDGLVEWMEQSENVTLIRGHGRFLGNSQIEVNNETLEGDNIFINTGTRSVVPKIDGLERVPWVDSAGLLDLEELPHHLLIVGGGYVGMEMAQVYKRLGAKVTIIQRGKQVLSREDKDVADEMQSILQDEGVVILTSADAKKVTQNDNGIALSVRHDGSDETLSGSHLLIAAGRQPNSDRLNLDSTGIQITERGHIVVDEHCHTGIDNIYALGDVNGNGAFTHTAVNDAEIVIDHMYSDGSRKLSDRIPIYAVFTDPPLGRVGLSEKDAIHSGSRVLKATRPMREISRAKEMGETKGFAKLLVDGDSDMILGASILGAGGDEIVNMFAAIMYSRIPCHEYRKVVLIHPTFSELMPWILDGLEEVQNK